MRLSLNHNNIRIQTPTTRSQIRFPLCGYGLREFSNLLQAALKFDGPLREVIQWTGNFRLAGSFIPEPTSNETKGLKLVFKLYGRINPAVCLRPFFQFCVNVLIDGRFDRGFGNRLRPLRYEELRNSFSQEANMQLVSS